MSSRRKAKDTQDGGAKSAWQQAQEIYESERLRLIRKGQRSQWDFGHIHSDKLRAEVAKYVPKSAWLMAQPEFKRFLVRSDGGKPEKGIANTNAKPTKPRGKSKSQ